MSNKYDWALFDLDGTITNPYVGITDSIKYACEKMSIPIPNEETLKLFIGPPLTQSFEQYCYLSKEESKQALKLYREHYSVVGIDGNIVYPGMVELLEKMKVSGIKITLATSKPEEFAILILKRFDLFKYFDFYGGNDLNESRPTKEDVIKYTLKSCNIKPNRAVMIGDRKFDINAGKLFELDTIAVTYGYGKYDELISCNPTYIANSPLDIYRFVI